MSHCSPCFNDFVAFREGARKSAKVRWIAVAAAVVLLATVAVWAWLRGRNAHAAKNEKIVAQNTGSYKDHLIDFRYQAPVRGPEQRPVAQGSNCNPAALPVCFRSVGGCILLATSLRHCTLGEPGKPKKLNSRRA